MAPSLFLIHNAKIWNSGGGDNTWMVFDQTDGYIREVGRIDSPLLKFTEHSRRDYKGSRVFPGFHEAHIHIGGTGKAEIELKLQGCNSIQELQDRLKRYVADNPTLPWFIGNGWEQSRLGRLPTREDLDNVCADKPVFLFRACHHIGVANSKALQTAGINKSYTPPEGSSIDKYPDGHPRQGNPTGILREVGAYVRVTENMVYSSENLKRAIKAAMKLTMSYGVTSAHSNDLTSWNEFCELADEDELPIRIFQAAYFRGRHSDNFPQAGERRGEMLSCDRIKIFSDGALGSATAALSIPYRGSQDKGLLMYSQEEMNSLVKEATGLGFRLEVHAIGDAGAESVLDALEVAWVAPQKRPLLTHSQILRKDLIERMHKLGVVANIQPQFLNTDCQWLEALVPPKLLEYAYTWKTLLKEGVVCSGGSDAPVEEPRPMLGIYDSIFRRVGQRSPDNKTIFKPEEALTVQEAVDMYTIGGAYATLQEHRLGQLRAGFQADFVVLQGQDDPVSNPELFATATVGEVWVAGKQKL